MLLLLLSRPVMLLAAADRNAGLVELLLQTLLLMMVRLERMRLFGVKSEMMPVSKQGHLDHSGPVKARLARRALALEGF